MNDGFLPLRFFDPRDEYFVVERKELPHWVQAGALCFITWRTWDSMPAAVVSDWLRRRNAWLVQRGIDPVSREWRSALRQLPVAEQREFRNFLAERWEGRLDECHGACPLRDPKLGRIVSTSLMHFDGVRYALTDYAVMPNHVHVLAAFPSAESVLPQVDSWKHYTAAAINRAVGRRGRFWEADGFDHLVRSAEEFAHLRSYIEDNPRRAGLQVGEFVHYRSASY